MVISNKSLFRIISNSNTLKNLSKTSANLCFWISKGKIIIIIIIIITIIIINVVVVAFSKEKTFFLAQQFS